MCIIIKEGLALLGCLPMYMQCSYRRKKREKSRAMAALLNCSYGHSFHRHYRRCRCCCCCCCCCCCRCCCCCCRCCCCCCRCCCCCCHCCCCVVVTPAAASLSPVVVTPAASLSPLLLLSSLLLPLLLLLLSLLLPLSSPLPSGEVAHLVARLPTPPLGSYRHCWGGRQPRRHLIRWCWAQGWSVGWDGMRDWGKRVTTNVVVRFRDALHGPPTSWVPPYVSPYPNPPSNGNKLPTSL